MIHNLDWGSNEKVWNALLVLDYCFLNRHLLAIVDWTFSVE
jgi:hypothetical protein